MRERIRGQLNFLFALMLGYNIWLEYAVGWIDRSWIALTAWRSGMDPASPALLEKAGEELALQSWDISLAVISGCILLFMVFRRERIFDWMADVRRGMTLYILVTALAVDFLLSYLAAAGTDPLVAALADWIGGSGEAALSAASDSSLTVSSFLYGGLLAPILEELVYRGLLLQKLRPFGRLSALLISSVCFGLMHGNFYQFGSAFVSGLVYGYIAMEFSLKWSVFLHIFDNMILVDLMGRLPDELYFRVQFLLMAAALLLAGICLVRSYRGSIPSLSDLFRREEGEPAGKRVAAALFTSPFFLIFLVYSIYLAVLWL